MRVRKLLGAVFGLVVIGVGVGFILGLIRPRSSTEDWWSSD
jgi:hypothetical protein